MAQQPERRICHVLTDEYGLRAFGGGLDRITGKKAGFIAVAWKLEGESSFKRDLSIDYRGNAASRLLLERKLKARTAATLEIGWPLIEPQESWESPKSELISYVGKTADPEMQQLEAMFRNPRKEHRLSLGRFVRNDDLGWIEAEIDWLGSRIRATIEAQLDIDIADQEKRLAALLGDQAGWVGKARKAIIDGLYELWRDGWRQDDPMLSEAEFAGRMQVESIGMQRDGGFDFWFKDADLFWGHGVLVRGTLDGGFEPGEMHG